MKTVFLVHSGEPWQHPQPPCSRPMIQFLERNESLVTWVQVVLESLLLLVCVSPALNAGLFLFLIRSTGPGSSPNQAK